MGYTISASEKTRKKASETETKALLYLMNFDEDSNEIYYYIIDVINDISGHSVDMNSSWDIQSKGGKSNSPRSIGEETVTLFKNYMSEFDFVKSILFLGGVSSTLRIDKTANVFGIENVCKDVKNNLIEGLKKACRKKGYIKKEWITDENINKFLEQLIFVIDDKEKYDYIREIINIKSTIIVTNEVLIDIFNTIRDVQSAKKNNMKVEGEVINSPSDALKFKRHMTSKEIRVMSLNRIVNANIMDKGMPLFFSEIICNLDRNEKMDVIEDCKLNITKALFDKNNSDNFWELFSEIYTHITENSENTIDELYNMISINKINNVHHLDKMSAKYLIALIMEVIYDYK